MVTSALLDDVSWKTIALAVPLAAAAILGGALAAKYTAAPPAIEGPALAVPETVTIAPRRFEYRLPGVFFRDGREVDPPLESAFPKKPLTIMKYQVSAASYMQCVAEGACTPVGDSLPAGADAARIPATGLNFEDARAYAAWFSLRTGETWRLPTDQELAFAAAERFPDDALGLDDSNNPALRWLENYRREAELKAKRQPLPQPFGHFGENAFGLADFAGNVWEWTSTCYRRTTLDSPGAARAGAADQDCGIYVTAGRHRAPMISFIRDPKEGGCSVGTPPEHLGVRLVREESWPERILRGFRLS
ncbi:MAG TPA: SUMF1/EgtB/PvdO family nonheme iron enzyme [Ferrovibrio sp.]|jgi:formylglycine-generating enzyme required for sulfatase activity|uniref:SUMF1/EgtB/PvdO family nonheme iron enzyme n=1 Tax=Ferrovibrio sp. TaxID=1917215 RepID=UPI002B4B021E|nr:SUMF1/EgtB/PvdO family nonheme iron enzyme [Ferrovibrio sp.]HLT76575.1 SUMF1/EgtB/PvdO family nonheme iron enzyme [Ferrovibrio sp.]